MKYLFIIYYYLMFLFRKKDPSVYIFNSYNNTHFNHNAQHFFEYCLTHTENHCLFIINDEMLREKLIAAYGDHFITSYKADDIKCILSAGVWVSSTAMPLRIPYANFKRFTINLWHGIPLKTIALLDKEQSFLKKLFFKLYYAKGFSCITSTSPLVSNIMQKSYGCSKQTVQILGQAWNDALWLPQSKQVFKDIFPTINLNAKYVLYAPTWRSNEKTIFFPFEGFELHTLQKILAKHNTYIFIRAHALDVQNITLDDTTPNILLFSPDKYSDVMKVLNLFDLLITDYSSICLDYLLLERPMVFLPYDYLEYEKSRGFSLPYHSYTPGPKPKTFTEFTEILITLLHTNTYADDIRNIQKKIHVYKYDNCQRIEKYIFSQTHISMTD